MPRRRATGGKPLRRTTPRVPGSPDHEHLRSPAALKIAELAAASDLFFAHFEHRARLALPDSWLAPGTDVDTSGSAWIAGTLPEPKYQAFRHDLLVASFHPGHRAKWTAHELCHALVGFAYRPGAPLLFHALGAWLAELLPVTLWYFFDEAGLRRCERHAAEGARFQEQCDACERLALLGMRRSGPADKALVREGSAFLDRELAAIARSRRLGRPEGTRFATIDLASDGLAYAHAHGARLRAPEMERYVAQFFGPDQGWHATLDDLEARVLEVSRTLTHHRALTPWQATRWDYAAQDVGYRLLAVRARLTGDLAHEVDRLIDGLASRRSRAGLLRATQDYQALIAGLGRGRKREALPSAEQVFAVGYELPGGLGHALQQLAEGVASACPGTYEALGQDRMAICAEFSRTDPVERKPIGRRFAAFLSSVKPGPVRDLACLEAALTHVAPRDPVSRALPWQEQRGERVMLAAGAELLRIDYDVLDRTPRRVSRAPKLKAPRFLGVVRSGSQHVDITELPAALGQVLLAAGERPLPRSELPVDDAVVEELLEHGLLVPESYHC